MKDFDTWWEEVSFIEDDGCYQEKYLAAEAAWKEKDNQLKEVIERLENIYYAPPIGIPPTSGDDFRKVCSDLKNYIEYLKEELL